MREIRPSGSEGGEAGNLTGLPYPYHGPTFDCHHRCPPRLKRPLTMYTRILYDCPYEIAHLPRHLSGGGKHGTV